MSRSYDNWERLVAAVLRREQYWRMCHENSRTPSPRSSVSSDFSASFRLSTSLSNASFDFEKQKHVLEFFRGSPFEFDLEELLMASSEVLGGEVETLKRTFLVSLREDVNVVVVKISKLDNIVPIDVLEELIKILGSIKNENVAKLRGYYLSKGEMLGFYDYFPQGSVHQMLHGKNQVALHWETRVRIAIDAARGLACMHEQFDGKFVHGNIKASNIFLNSKGDGCLGDAFSDFQISGYHPPEVLRTKILSQASDVYCFGVFLIELLSGKSPLHYRGRHKTFVDWACREARKEWTALVFDASILETDSVKKEMLDMLGIALYCVKEKAEERPKMELVVRMLGIVCCEVPLNFFSAYRILTRGLISYYNKMSK